MRLQLRPRLPKPSPFMELEPPQLPPPTPQRTKETKTQALNPKSLLVPGHSQFSSNNNGNFGLILLFILFYFIIYYYYYYFFFSCTKLMSNYLVLADL
jgi:hypothetical protein